MKIFLMFIAMVTCQGCLSRADILRLQTERAIIETRCIDIKIEPIEAPFILGADPIIGGYRMLRLNAIGCEREWISDSLPSGWGAFVETETSRARTEARACADRLSLQAKCDKKLIVLITRTDFKVGTEQAFRFRACSKEYICTMNAGHIECKVD